MGIEGNGNISPLSDGGSIADMVAIACQLAGRGGIGWVQIVSGSRPTYNELIHFRRWADARGLGMTVSASVVSIQPRRQPATVTHTRPLDTSLLEWSAALGDRLSLVLDRVRNHGRWW